MTRHKDNTQHVAQLEQYLNRRGPGDEEHAPTPQRLARAQERGEVVRAKVIHSEAGFPTASFYWTFTGAVDQLRKRGALTAEEYEAAFRFLRHFHHSMHRGAPTSKITPRHDGNVSDLTPTERQWHYTTLVDRAFEAVPRYLWPGMAWLVQSMGDGKPLQVLGAHYAPNKGIQTQSSQGAAWLRATCLALVEHYGIGDKSTQARLDRLVKDLRAKLTAANGG